MAQQSGLTFLHLSDIHFRQEVHAQAYDLNADIRRKLIEDAAREAKRLDCPASALLISGDIGYAGKSADYEVATKWLGQLCETVGTPTTAICCVPGNHDIDRDTVNRRTMKDARKCLRACNRDQIDSEITEYL